MYNYYVAALVDLYTPHSGPQQQQYKQKNKDNKTGDDKNANIKTTAIMATIMTHKDQTQIIQLTIRTFRREGGAVEKSRCRTRKGTLNTKY